MSIIVVANKQNPDHAAFLTKYQAAASQHALGFERIGSRRLRGAGKPHRLNPEQSDELYKLVHRQATLVVAPGDVDVIDRNGRAHPLGRVLRYKALVRLQPDQGVPSVIAEFFHWRDNSLVSAPSDPRVLPLHIFDPGGDHEHLETSVGRTRFKQRYRRSGSFVDKRKRPWQAAPPNQRHTMATATVRGLVLPVGYQWDVQSPHKKSSIECLSARFDIKKKDHRNVFPDGAIT